MSEWRFRNFGYEIHTTIPPRLILLNEFVVEKVPSVAPTVAEDENLRHVHTAKFFRILDVDGSRGYLTHPNRTLWFLQRMTSSKHVRRSRIHDPWLLVHWCKVRRPRNRIDNVKRDKNTSEKRTVLWEDLKETSGTVDGCAMTISYICQALAFHAVIPATSDYSRILIDKRIAWGREGPWSNRGRWQNQADWWTLRWCVGKRSVIVGQARFGFILSEKFDE